MDQFSFYSFDQYGSIKSLALHDREPRGDLGNPDRTTWALRTRKLFDTGWGDTNIIMGHGVARYPEPVKRILTPILS